MGWWVRVVVGLVVIGDLVLTRPSRAIGVQHDRADGDGIVARGVIGH
jgi:hypothetical protein